MRRIRRYPASPRRVRGLLAAVALVTLVGAGCEVADPGPADVLTPKPYPTRPPDRPAISYAPGASHLLDLYEPPGSGGQRPLIVFVHGGGFSGGSRSGVVPSVLRFADPSPPTAEGYVVASIDYPLLSAQPANVTMRDMVKDVRRAIQFLQDHAVEYGIDADRVVVAGTSAGAYLATMAAVADGPAWEPVAGRTTSVQGFVNQVGPTDVEAFLDGASTETSIGGQLFAGAFAIMAGCTVTGGTVSPNDPCRAVLRDASPVTQVDPGDPDGYLVCGTGDDIVPCAFVAPLNALTRSLDVVEQPGVNGHGSTDYGLNLTALAEFLDRVTSTAT